MAKTKYEHALLNCCKEEKEAFAQSKLLSLLSRHRCFTAIPFPDLGDDIWFRPRYTGAPILRGQLKSSFTWEPRKRTKNVRYLLNIQVESLKDLASDKLYIIALAQTANPADPEIDFGFIPSAFFDGSILENLRFSLKSKRMNLHIERHSGEDQRGRILLHLRNHKGVDLNPYFDTHLLSGNEPSCSVSGVCDWSQLCGNR